MNNNNNNNNINNNNNNNINKPSLSRNNEKTSLKPMKSLSYRIASNTSKDRVVLVYGDRIQVRKKDLKKRGSHTCDMQALQPLPVPTTTHTATCTGIGTAAGTVPALTSGCQTSISEPA